MENYLFAAVLALIYTVAMLVCPYIIVIVAANVAYRLMSGRYFRWWSRRTLVPFCVLSAGGWSFFFYALLTSPVFLITH